MNIRDIRKEEKISQKAFAEKYNIKLRTLQNWEQNRYQVPDAIINNIYKVHRDELELKKIKEIKFNLDKPFKICIDKPFMNCEKIFPIQQKKVAEILEDIKNDNNVNRVIIFGSSITYNCHIGSDVDIYFELNEEINPLKKSYSFEYDYWNNFRVDLTLKNEILKTGVVVYER